MSAGGYCFDFGLPDAGYRRCRLPVGHDGDHQGHDGSRWADDVEPDTCGHCGARYADATPADRHEQIHFDRIDGDRGAPVFRARCKVDGCGWNLLAVPIGGIAPDLRPAAREHLDWHAYATSAALPLTDAPEPAAPPAVVTADGSDRVSVGDGDREAVSDLLSLPQTEPSRMGQRLADDRRAAEERALVEAYRRGKRAGQAAAAVAPGEIGIEDAGCVQVVMLPAALAAYRRWLTGRDLHLYRIPGLGDGDLPTYAIGIGAERPGAAGGVS